jgi:hypothetical protein
MMTQPAGDVVVRQFLALQLLVIGERTLCRCQVAVERRALVRVLAVAHVLHLLESQVEGLRVGGAGGVGLVRAEAGQVVGDGRVVLRRVREHFLGQRELGLVADIAGRRAGSLHLGQHQAVVGRIAHHHHVTVVLGCRAQHGRAANVDVLDRIFKRALVLGHGLLERVQVHHHHVDGRDVVLGQLGDVFRQVAAREDAAMDFRVQRFHAAVEHFRKAGVVSHFGHLHAVVLQQLGGAAGGQDIDAERGQRAREIEHAGLVGDGDKGLFDHGCGLGSWNSAIGLRAWAEALLWPRPIARPRKPALTGGRAPAVSCARYCG